MSRVLAAMRPLRHRRAWLALWGLMVLAVVVLSLIPPPPMPAVAFRGIDKVEHVLGYLALSAMATALFAPMPVRARIAAALVALGIALEIAQGTMTTTRTPDLPDALANAAGVLLGLACTPAVRLVAWLDRRVAGRGRQDPGRNR